MVWLVFLEAEVEMHHTDLNDESVYGGWCTDAAAHNRCG